jgi:hypothetical protein
VKEKYGPLEKKDKKRLTSAEMKFFRRTAGYTLFDHKNNEEILEVLKVEPVDENLRRYKSNWLRHETRMNSSRMAKRMLNCRPNGQRQLVTDDDDVTASRNHEDGDSMFHEAVDTYPPNYTWHTIPEGHNHYSHCHVNFRSHHKSISIAL